MAHASRRWRMPVNRLLPWSPSVCVGKRSNQSTFAKSIDFCHCFLVFANRATDAKTALARNHPGGNPWANLKSMSHRCHLMLVAFVWELTKGTIHLPLGCLQGGARRGAWANGSLGVCGRRGLTGGSGQVSEREFFIDNLLVRIQFITVMIRWTGLAPWEFEFPLPGSLASTLLPIMCAERRVGERVARATSNQR